ncbi:MAG: SEL1-like repeat protein [Clostridia bacterium]|nr:SEL1-like repeat protein [Clostridia bacterium]
MVVYECPRCGGALRRENEYHKCSSCMAKFVDDSVEKAYKKLETNFRNTLQEVFSEALYEEKRAQIANARRNLWSALRESYINTDEVLRCANKIRELAPEDIQGQFYSFVSEEHWVRVNKLLKGMTVGENAKELAAMYVEDFVEYLCNPFVEKCQLRLKELIGFAFDEKSEEYKRCHDIINKAISDSSSGLHDPCVPRNVFVAYSSKDKEKAYELVEALEQHGVSCFISMRNLPKGRGSVQMYQTNLETAIDHCQVFAFVSTRNSRSNYCDALTKEIRYVKEKDIDKLPHSQKDYYNTHYGEVDVKIRKPRVQWLLEQYGATIYDEEVKDFFEGFSWCTDIGEVYQAIRVLATNRPVSTQPQQAQKNVKYCVECGAENAKNVKFCGECGGQVFAETKEELERLKKESDSKYCLACGTKNPKAMKFCGECGSQQFVDTHKAYLDKKAEEKRRIEEEKEAARKKAEEAAAEEKRKMEMEAELQRQLSLYKKELEEKKEKERKEAEAKRQEELYKQRLEEEKEKLRKAAEAESQASLEELYKLAGDHFYGRNGKTVNQAEGAKYYRQAAERGHASSQNSLGFCYGTGQGVAKDYNEAIKWYRKAAEQGNMYGQNSLGFCYGTGQGVKKDYNEAIKWYRKAAEQGNMYGQYNLANHYYSGNGVDKNYAEAVKWYRKAAVQGDADAQNSLAICYEKGQGVMQDWPETVKWFRKAAAQGNMYAQYNLGWCYDNGKGVVHNYTEAVRWYRKAAEQGNMRAQRNLGWCYNNGKGVTPNSVEAARLYRKSAEQGYADAKIWCDKLGQMGY